MEIGKDVFEFMFPKDMYEYVYISEWQSDDGSVTIIFEEKDMPPLDDSNKNKHIIVVDAHSFDRKVILSNKIAHLDYEMQDA